MKTPRKWISILMAITMLMTIIGVAFAAEAQKININTATAEELVQLERVGPSYAEKIVDFREKNGPFKTPEDIMQVAGIGPKTFEANKDRIVVK